MDYTRNRYSLYLDNKYYIDKEHKSVKITPSVNLSDSLRKEEIESEDE